jgi:hypothetical protein
MGEINSHHVWGLSAALRSDLSSHGSPVTIREIRVGLPVNPSQEEQQKNPRTNTVSEEIGNLCAGFAAAASKKEDSGRLIKLDSFEVLDAMLSEYNVATEGKELPHYMCNQGEMSGSL